MTPITGEQQASLIAFDIERRERCERIMARYAKAPLEKHKHTRKPWTAKELSEFKSWGCQVTVTTNKNQQQLF